MSHECFADEIAIDFPSVGRVVERMRGAFLGEADDADVLRTDVLVSQRDAFVGLVVPLTVPIHVTCPDCGGRGETWTERCHLCNGTGKAVVPHGLRVSIPPRSADGKCVRFRVRTQDGSTVRIEVKIAIRA